jgi:hypothetical protein
MSKKPAAYSQLTQSHKEASSGSVEARLMQNRPTRWALMIAKESKESEETNSHCKVSAFGRFSQQQSQFPVSQGVCLLFEDTWVN